MSRGSCATFGAELAPRARFGTVCGTHLPEVTAARRRKVSEYNGPTRQFEQYCS